MNSPNDVIKEFLLESHENLARMDVDLVALEKGCAAPQTIASVFRTIHTLKGSAGFLSFHQLESLAHVAEGLLSKMRDGKIAATADVVTALLSTVDAVREMLQSIESSGQDGKNDYAHLIATLNSLRDPAPKSAVEAQSEITDASLTATLMDLHKEESLTQLFRGSDATQPAPPPDKKVVDKTQQVTATAAGASPAQPPATQPPARAVRGSPDSAHLPPSPDTPSPRSVQPPGEAAAREPTKSLGAATSKVTDSTIRLDVTRVDKLMNLVSELVLARNQILQHTLAQSDASLASASRNLSLITSELQEVVMTVRMQPIGNIWGQMPRVVRDLAVACGKQVRVELEGSETELDKTVVEAMRDPLTHLVRNAVDHGIELPAVRESAGKPTEGRLHLCAYHESGQVHIEISDDGAGIDRQRVKAKAIERGLITPDQADGMSDQSVVGLVFLPGFSTTSAVSHLSGRGVGMDVVKNNVEKIGGTVDVQSTIGAGTRIKMRIPLTLAIIRALMVNSAGERYAIPQASMIELIRLEGDKARTSVERIHGTIVYRFRGKLLPLVHLERVLGGTGEINSEVINIVVLQADEHEFGLVVDSITDTQEIVVKALSKLLRGVPCLAGATIMGDGRVALILDVLGLAERAGVITRAGFAGLLEVEPPAKPAAEPQRQLVLVGGAHGERLGVPLEMVARLEEFPASAIEWSGSRPVAQYRGSILSLIDFFGYLERPPDRQNRTESLATASRVQVVVCTDGSRSIGLVVEQILDIVSDPLLVQSRATREHVMFTSILDQRVTEILDVPSLISTSEPLFAAAGKP